MKIRLLPLITTLFVSSVYAVNGDEPQADSTQTYRTREYTKENPLVFEDEGGLWPYAFLSEKGQPSGFDIDLAKMVLDELNIPYVIKLGSTQETFEDLRDGKSDLTMGLSVDFHDEYGMYGSPITLFTQSLASPKGSKVEIKGLKDLGSHKVIVKEGSFCYHVMMDNEWDDNIILVPDMKDALLQMSSTGEGMIVWNTPSLKWLMDKYHLDNLQLTPINMPHGEYMFMSNDPVLLHKIDSVYTQLDSNNKLVSIRNKWFYPERQASGTHPRWWLLVGAAAMLALILSIYAIVYNIRVKRLSRHYKKVNKRLAFIIENSHVRIWTYEFATELITWYNEDGRAAYTYSSKELMNRYNPEDYEKLMQTMKRLHNSRLRKNSKEEEATLSIRAVDPDSGETEERSYHMVLSVLRRDKRGRATTVLVTNKDITEQVKRKTLVEDNKQRYQAIFNLPAIGIFHFDKDGILTDINDTACELFALNRKEVIEKKKSYRDLLYIDVDMDKADGYTCTQTIDLTNMPHEQRFHRVCPTSKKLVIGIRLMLVRNEEGQTIDLFAICRDRTIRECSIEQNQQVAKELQDAQGELAKYYEKMDILLQAGNIRMAVYSVDSHTMTILMGRNNVQHTLTQSRCMALIDNTFHSKAVRILDNMDERTESEQKFDIKTNLRPKGDYPLHLMFSLIPVHNANGELTEYFGLCRDITEQKANEEKLTVEAQKVQEVENTKTCFVNNMVQEIRKPMDTIVKSAANLDADTPESNEVQCKAILNNSNHLLHLIDNVLYLSRLEAHMIEIENKPNDFVDTFAAHCLVDYVTGDKVKFNIESPYEQLVLNIDAQKVGNVVQHIVENAVKHTTEGSIRARYDYIGYKLIITVEDSGCGIPRRELEKLNNITSGQAHNSKGLGIPICKELLTQMGGTIEISSEEGRGTTVWIIIPCQASVIKRKKMA